MIASLCLSVALAAHAGTAALPLPPGGAVGAGMMADQPPAAARGPILRVLARGEALARVRPGERLSVPIQLDLSQVSSGGGVGSIDFELRFDPAVLRFESAVSALPHALAAVQGEAPGRIRFALATTEGQGTGTLTLFTVQFSVAPGAAPGARQEFALSLAHPPLDLTGRPYDAPRLVCGAVAVVGR